MALAALAFAAVTVVTYLIAEKRMFMGFAPYDDEGYMLIALKGFINHGSLYDDVFSQYGPFYYEFWGGIFSLFGIPVAQDGGRTATLIVWVLSSLLLGHAGWRMTGSVLLGLAVQVLVFTGIVTLTNEPMHPGGLICLLLAAIVAISCLVRDRVAPYSMAALGAAVAALTMVKINVGFFALAAVALVAVVSYPGLVGRRWLRPLVEVGFVALPVLLMTSKLSEAWARHYALHVAVAALAVVIALRARTVRRRSDEELRWFGGGLLVVGLTICATILATGTTPNGLLDGVLGQPLRQADVFSVPLSLAGRTYLFDLLALVGVLGYWYVARGERRPSAGWSAAASLLGIVIGAQLALSVIGRTVLFDAFLFPGYQFAMLPFAWIALIPGPAGENGATAFARLLLPPLAVLQALHAFPVAGSQLSWSAFLLVPVGAICVANGVRGLAIGLSGERERRAALAIATAAVAVLAAVLVETQLRKPLQEVRAAYDERISLGLPGAADIHVEPQEARTYRVISRAIEANCGSFLTLPGLNSFYLWTERDPPTGFNTTAWTTLLDDPSQRMIVSATRSTADLCVLENAPMAAGWSGGTIPDGPLVRYLRGAEFRTVFRFGDYALRRREDPAGSSS